MKIIGPSIAKDARKVSGTMAVRMALQEHVVHTQSLHGAEKIRHQSERLHFSGSILVHVFAGSDAWKSDALRHKLGLLEVGHSIVILLSYAPSSAVFDSGSLHSIPNQQVLSSE